MSMEHAADDLHRLYSSAGANPHTGQALPSLLDLLREAMEPGTPRRWTECDLTPGEAERMAAEVFRDRDAALAATRGGYGVPGFTAAPLRVDVADVLIDTEVGLVELEAAVTDRLGLTPLAGAPADARARRIGESLIPPIAEIPDLAGHVAAEAARLARSAARAIGDKEQVVRLKVRCPICDARSIRAFIERDLAACVNADCRCGDSDCGCADGRRPARHRWDLDWFKEVISEQLEAV